MFQLKWIWANLKGYRLRYVLVYIMTAILACMFTINPRILSTLIDEVFVGVANDAGVVESNLDILVPSMIVIGIVTLVRLSLQYISGVMADQCSLGAITTIRLKIYENLQGQEMQYYDRNRTGDLMTRLTGDMDMVRHATAYIFRQLVLYTIMFIATIVYFLTVNVWFTLCLVAITPVMYFVSTRFTKQSRPKYADLREKLSNLNTFSQENISGNHVVKAFARENYEIERFRVKDKEFHDANLQATFIWLRFFPIIEGVANSFTIMVILVGGLFIITGQLTQGELMSFYSLTWSLADPMRMLGTLLNDLQRFFASAAKVIEVYYAKPTIVNRNDAVASDKRFAGSVEFRDVSFAYGKTRVFDHVSFQVEPGQTLAIMGATGSGKTTLTNLILRFYDVHNGEVLVDGRNVKFWTLNSLRRNIGVATQEVFLFSDTVDGNIAYGDGELSEEEVRFFANAAAADFIDKMPEGYDTIIGERGVGLSGGQRQRLALARALAIRPSILILDDTTSAVDLETEKYIQEQLDNLPFSCTKIIIAQRISSVKNADKIMILADGKIAEMGTHAELLKQNGYYNEIYNLQNDNMALYNDETPVAVEGGAL